MNWRKQCMIGPGLAMVIFLITGCGGPATSDLDVQVVDETNRMETWVDQPGVAVVDVRPYSDYQQAHIPGAIHRWMPHFREGDAELSDRSGIVVYAQNDDDTLGMAAAKRLVALEYENVSLYRPGLEGWVRNGGQVVSSPQE